MRTSSELREKLDDSAQSGMDPADAYAMAVDAIDTLQTAEARLEEIFIEGVEYAMDLIESGKRDLPKDWGQAEYRRRYPEAAKPKLEMQKGNGLDVNGPFEIHVVKGKPIPPKEGTP